LGATHFGLDRVVFANVRAGRLGQAGIALEEGCALTGQTEQNCEGNRVIFLAASGRLKQAEAMLDDLVRDTEGGKHPVGGYSSSMLAALYLEVANINKATDLQKLVLDGNDWIPTQVLIRAPGGAKLPEEISTDPEWLAVWADPRIEDVISVYRQNLLAWRELRTN
jgi:hypothetical protein